eukprot:765089-Hanusia_phi.AAC.2
MLGKYRGAAEHCRKLNAELQNLKGSMRILCRVRPLRHVRNKFLLLLLPSPPPPPPPPPLLCLLLQVSSLSFPLTTPRSRRKRTAAVFIYVDSVSSQCWTREGARSFISTQPTARGGNFNPPTLPSPPPPSLPHLSFPLPPPPSLSNERMTTARSTQEELFDDARALLQTVVDGYNVSVFAYGPTGSGKSYSITGGGGKHRGMAYRMLEDLFRTQKERAVLVNLQVGGGAGGGGRSWEGGERGSWEEEEGLGRGGEWGGRRRWSEVT